MRLLSAVLAVAMLLSASALAAGRDHSGSEDRQLVMEWLDWDGEGHCYASDEALSAEGGAADLAYTPYRGDHVIFFLREGAEKTPVLPEAGEGVRLEKVSAETVTAEAQQSEYYVIVRLEDWEDGELTYDGLTFPVRAEVPVEGFFTETEFSRETVYNNSGNVDELADWTLYFGACATDEDHGYHVEDVAVSENGTPDRFDLKKVDDQFWAVTIHEDAFDQDGGVDVALDVTKTDAEGRTWTEEQGQGFWRDQPGEPELWLCWAHQGEDGFLHINEDECYGGFQPHPGDYCDLVFFTCDYDEEGEQTLTPVKAEDLTGSEGVTIRSTLELGQVDPADELAECYVDVQVDEWEKEYTISYNGYVMHFNSNLPDIAFYTAPEMSVESWTETMHYTPAQPAEVYYMGSVCTDEDNGRHLVKLELPAGREDNDSFTLAGAEDGLYTISLKKGADLNREFYRVSFDATWADAQGHTWVDEDWTFDIWSGMSLLYSEEPLVEGVWGEIAPVPYGDVAGQVSTEITMEAGEEKTVYLSALRSRTDRDEVWLVYGLHPAILHASGETLTIQAETEEDPTRFTLRCEEPGEYRIYAASVEISLRSKDGEAISAGDLGAAFVDVDWDGGPVFYDENGEMLDIAFDGTIETAEGQLLDHIFPITVTVTGGGSVSYSDVEESRWFYPAVSFVTRKGMMNGSNGAFNPGSDILGAEFVQIMYNRAGRPGAGEGTFAGVEGRWFAEPILWAAGEGLITDAGDSALTPDQAITRQEMALILYNAMGRPDAQADLSGFADADQISGWALDAVKWAVSEGVLQGSGQEGAKRLNPAGSASRAETAQMLMNYFG